MHLSCSLKCRGVGLRDKKHKFSKNRGILKCRDVELRDKKTKFSKYHSVLKCRGVGLRDKKTKFSQNHSVLKCSALSNFIEPISHLAGADGVGADVHPWPGEPMAPFGKAHCSRRGSSLPDTFSKAHGDPEKCGRSSVPATKRNQVGAAWSAYLLLAYHTLTARKPARSRLSPGLFPLSPKSVRERGVHPWPCPPIAHLDAHHPKTR